MAANETSGSSPARARSMAQIEADLQATRQRLTVAVESLIDQVHPARIKQRQIERLKQGLNTQLESARALVFTARGDLRTDRVVAAGAAVAGALVVLFLVRRFTHRAGTIEP